MLSTLLTLPCGAILPNRLAKAAMTERLSRADGLPNELHQHLYARWAQTGAGLLITGNIMIDRRHLESAGNVVIDTESHLPALRAWAASSTSGGNRAWVQLNHSGRQTALFVNPHPHSASDIQLRKLGLFGKPRPMSEAQIEATIEGFVRTALLCQRAGFTGVQIHAAHGYLLSQFLSPLTNRRTDRWGGSLENRSRLLMEIVTRVRAAAGPAFPLSVKLNSADFQRGGFEETDSLQVVKMLGEAGIDLLELSGGTYERLVFLVPEEGEGMRESTRQREAYFLDFAQRAREVSQVPIMLTGGFRSYDACVAALQSGAVDVIGMARPFLSDIDQIPAFIRGEVDRLQQHDIRTGIALFESAAEGGFHARQLIRLAKGKAYQPGLSAMGSANFFVISELRKALTKHLAGTLRTPSKA